MKQETCERCGAAYVRLQPAHGKSKYCYTCKVEVANDRINAWKRNNRKIKKDMGVVS